MKILTFAALAFAAHSLTAFAADLPATRLNPLPTPLPVFPPTGVDLDITAGYAFDTDRGFANAGKPQRRSPISRQGFARPMLVLSRSALRMAPVFAVAVLKGRAIATSAWRDAVPSMPSRDQASRRRQAG